MNVASPAPATPALPANPTAGSSNGPNGAGAAEPFAQALQQARSTPPGEAAEAPAPSQRPPQSERKDTTRSHKPEARDRSRQESASGPTGARVPADTHHAAAEAPDLLGETLERPTAADVPALPSDLPPWLQALAPMMRPQDPAAPRADLTVTPPEGAEPTAAARRPARAAGLSPADAGAEGADAARKPPVTGAGPEGPSLADAGELQALRQDLPPADFGHALRAAAGGEAGSPTPLAAASSAAMPGLQAAIGFDAATALPEREVRAPLHSPAFAPALGAQLTLLVKEGVTEARLHLNPAEMGPIAVQIHLDGSLARVEMVAEQAATRQVLEQSMPSLASALRDSGLTLAGGGVFDQASRQPQRGEAEGGRATRGQLDAGSAAEGPEGLATARPAGAPRGVVDLYA